MWKRLLLVTLFVGCATSDQSHRGDAPIVAAAIRFAAGDLCAERGPCDVLFLSVNGQDPPIELLALLSDLSARPRSAAEFIQKKPGAVWLQPTEKGTRAEGHVFAVERVQVSRRQATVDLLYGSCDCRLHMVKAADGWLVRNLEIRSIVVF